MLGCSNKQLCLILGLSAFAIFLLIGTTTGQSTPIKCYQCNSFYDRGCTDFFDNRTYPLISCPANTTMCRKVVQETYYDGMWDVRYIRQCAQHGEVGPMEGRWCQERTGTFRVKVRYCHCSNKDGCNDASSFHINPLLTAFCLIMMLLLPIAVK